MGGGRLCTSSATRCTCSWGSGSSGGRHRGQTPPPPPEIPQPGDPVGEALTDSFNEGVEELVRHEGFGELAEEKLEGTGHHVDVAPLGVLQAEPLLWGGKWGGSACTPAPRHHQGNLGTATPAHLGTAARGRRSARPRSRLVLQRSKGIWGHPCPPPTPNRPSPCPWVCSPAQPPCPCPTGAPSIPSPWSTAKRSFWITDRFPLIR